MIAVAWGEPTFTIAMNQTLAQAPIPRSLEPLRERVLMIAADVGEKHDLPPAVIMGDRRKAEVVRARHEVYWRALHETGATASQIAKVTGVFDHSVVYRAAASHAAREQVLRDSKPLPITPLSTDCPYPNESPSSF